MANPIADLPRYIPLPRQQYLYQNEGRIRSLALPARTTDPQVAIHLDYMLFAEDLLDRHAVAVVANRKAPNREHAALEHEILVAKAEQLKLYHLDQLAHLLI